MKVAVPLAKNILGPSWVTAAASAIDNFNDFNNFKWRNGWYNENCSSPWRF